MGPACSFCFQLEGEAGHRMAARERSWFQPATDNNVLKTLDTGSPRFSTGSSRGGRRWAAGSCSATTPPTSARPCTPSRTTGRGWRWRLSGLRGLARRGGGRDPGRPGLGPLRAQGAADPGRGHLRRRRDHVGRHAERRGAAHRADAIGMAIGADLEGRHRLHRRVCAEGQARVADHAAAGDDHGRDPRLLHRRADHLQRIPGQRGHGRLAAGPGPGRGPGPDRAGAAHADA